MRSLTARSDFLWRLAKGLIRDSVFRISWFVLVAAPLLAAVVSNIESSSGFAAAMLNLVDAHHAKLPINMARAFWASLLLVSTYLIFNLAAPARARFDDSEAWQKSAGGKFRASILRARGLAAPEVARRVAARFEQPSSLLATIVRAPFLLLFVVLESLALTLLGEIALSVLSLVGGSQPAGALLPHFYIGRMIDGVVSLFK